MQSHNTADAFCIHLALQRRNVVPWFCLQVKVTVGSKKVLKLFLVDRAGSKHLAATGEDLGDAHYLYRSTKPFSKYGRLECHNRNELHIWCVAACRTCSKTAEATAATASLQY
jgi:hypothetical protein